MIRIISLSLLVAVFFIPISAYAEENKTTVFKKESIDPDIYNGLKSYIEQSQTTIQNIENKNSQNPASSSFARHKYCATCEDGCVTCSLTVGGNTGQAVCAVLHPSCTVGKGACSEPEYDISCRGRGLDNTSKPH